jgi:hypothetical protein
MTQRSLVIRVLVCSALANLVGGLGACDRKGEAPSGKSGEQPASQTAAPGTGQPPSEPGRASEVPGEGVFDEAYRALAGQFDRQNGGFGFAPKFPSAHILSFLLRYGARGGDAQALELVERTLAAMRAGGVFDQVGLGFHRYATDARWRVPHYEKMLYDQAMIALAYTEAWQVTGKPLYRRTAEEVFAYVLRELTSPEGAFYSAMDADSEEATRNGSMSMSTSRVMAPIESLVCSVLSTKCPVSAERMAISAVSWSRISPTRMMSGSWRKIERRPRAKVSPMPA